MSDDLLGGGSAGKTGRDDKLLPEGFYRELRLVKATVSRMKNLQNNRCFVAKLEVLSPVAGVSAGQAVQVSPGEIGDYFEQLEGSDYPSYDQEARGRVLLFLGTLFGYSRPAEIDAHVNTQTLALVTGDAQPMTGTVICGRLTHRTTKKGKVIGKWSELAPVIDPATGKNKVVRGPVAGAAPAQAAAAFPTAQLAPAVGGMLPAPTPALAPAPAPVAAAPAPTIVDHLARARTVGWEPHPTSAGWFQHLGLGVCKTEQDLRTGNF